MRIAPLVFVLLLSLCACLTWVWLTPQPPFAAGEPHPSFSTMLHGGDGWARHERILVPGSIFGLLSITLTVSLMALGLARDGRLVSGARALLIGWGLFMAIFVALVWTYRGYATEGSETLILGFPPPTAWMLYGIWFFPFYFMILYITRFDEWVMSGDEIARFHRMVEQHKRAEQAGASSGESS